MEGYETVAAANGTCRAFVAGPDGGGGPSVVHFDPQAAATANGRRCDFLIHHLR